MYHLCLHILRIEWYEVVVVSTYTSSKKASHSILVGIEAEVLWSLHVLYVLVWVLFRLQSPPGPSVAAMCGQGRPCLTCHHGRKSQLKSYIYPVICTIRLFSVEVNQF